MVSGITAIAIIGRPQSAAPPHRFPDAGGTGERRVPQLALRVQGELRLFDDPGTGISRDLSPYDAAPTADDLSLLGAGLSGFGRDR